MNHQKKDYLLKIKHELGSLDIKNKSEIMKYLSNFSEDELLLIFNMFNAKNEEELLEKKAEIQHEFQSTMKSKRNKIIHIIKKIKL